MGDDPQYHHPVFVLTRHHFVLARHPRASITMQGGTTFHLVDDGIKGRSSERSRPPTALTSGSAVCFHRPAITRAGLTDELHVVIVPILLGGGERLFDNLAGGPEGYECVEYVNTGSVAHVRLVRALR